MTVPDRRVWRRVCLDLLPLLLFTFCVLFLGRDLSEARRSLAEAKAELRLLKTKCREGQHE